MDEAKIKNTVEHHEIVGVGDSYTKPKEVSDVTGTVKLAEETDTRLIPTPSADPRDPLNLSPWRKFIFVMLLSVCKLASVVRLARAPDQCRSFVSWFIDGVGLWRTAQFLHPRLCCCRRRLRRHHCTHDLPVDVHGHRKHHLSATGPGHWASPGIHGFHTFAHILRCTMRFCE
ncbi:major facilitator superfamily transporter [Macrophomina phaseolina MS6]|uniref:Major facilitator superfamily transporter n=1 Tax=Macrophomina phaseolina (strain MS6) TaxID=1126212 RepID=K2RSK8_MACPH|nr:major facilitator superfamily transporter [Macrophomina phaseolina MS6]